MPADSVTGAISIRMASLFSTSLRAHFPHAESFLMDRATLMSCERLWGREKSPVEHDLRRLHPAETALYEDLRANRLGERLRLEQERIGFDRVLQALSNSKPRASA